ncbi:MAG TPA: cytochrome c oxidase assembly protein [Solirubrobacteraceae bacterium]|nr:cytochrome c oxidase assembly protein [Solirubrobacteraceae bacterium]
MSSHPGWSSWSFDPIVILALLGAAFVYVSLYRRAVSRSSSSPPGAGHWVPYAAGLLTIAVALLSPLDPVGDRYLLSAHMIQHVLLSDIAPALLVLGLRAPILPLGLSREALLKVAPAGGRSGRLLSRLTSPWLAVPLWAIATWVWAIPAVFDFAAQHQVVHALEHATLFYTGLALWWLIVDPLPRARLRPNGQRLALLGFTRLASAGVCLPLTWITATQYPLYAGAARAYGLSAINDQHLAGASMCFIEALVFGIAFAAVFISMLGRDDSRAALGEYAAAGSRVDLPT